MPFDGVNHAQVAALDKIDRVIDFLESEERWCKGTLETPDGRRCMMGALRRAEAQLLEPMVRGAIREVTGKKCWSVESFNDAPTTTHPVMMRVLTQVRHRVEGGDLVLKNDSAPLLARWRSWLGGNGGPFRRGTGAA